MTKGVNFIEHSPFMGACMDTGARPFFGGGRFFSFPTGLSLGIPMTPSSILIGGPTQN